MLCITSTFFSPVRIPNRTKTKIVNLVSIITYCSVVEHLSGSPQHRLTQGSEEDPQTDSSRLTFGAAASSGNQATFYIVYFFLWKFNMVNQCVIRFKRFYRNNADLKTCKSIIHWSEHIPGIMEHFLGGRKEQCCCSSEPFYEPAPHTSPVWRTHACRTKSVMSWWLLVQIQCTCRYGSTILSCIYPAPMFYLYFCGFVREGSCRIQKITGKKSFKNKSDWKMCGISQITQTIDLPVSCKPFSPLWLLSTSKTG